MRILEDKCGIGLFWRIFVGLPMASIIPEVGVLGVFLYSIL